MKTRCRICGKNFEAKDDIVNCHNKCYLDKYKKDFPNKYKKMVKENPEFIKEMVKDS